MTGPKDSSEAAQCPFLQKQKQVFLIPSHPDQNELSRIFTPHCRWYQREKFVYLTVEVMDCQSPDISVANNKLFFSCLGDEMKNYILDIELFKSISIEVSRPRPPRDLS